MREMLRACGVVHKSISVSAHLVFVFFTFQVGQGSVEFQLEGRIFVSNLREKSSFQFRVGLLKTTQLRLVHSIIFLEAFDCLFVLIVYLKS